MTANEAWLEYIKDKPPYYHYIGQPAKQAFLAGWEAARQGLYITCPACATEGTIDELERTGCIKKIMKIKIKIPENNAVWPMDYNGKEVEVEIVCVKFPDGNYWECECLTAKLATEEKPETRAPQGLPEIFGQELSRLEVIFK